MAMPKFVGTGVADVDALTIQDAKASSTYVAHVVITGQGGPVIKTIPHLLGRVPASWAVKRSQPAAGISGEVVEAADGKWSASDVELQFNGSGSWDIEFS